MSNYSIDYVDCTLCGKCVEACPFDAMRIVDEQVKITAACKACGVCVETCPEDAITKVEKDFEQVDKDAYEDVMIFAEQLEGEIHPVTYELMGKGRELADKLDQELHVVLLGHELEEAIEDIRMHGADKVFVYDHEELHHFEVERYTEAIEDCVKRTSPTILLMGGTSIGRSLAPRVASRIVTGLTADCTILDVRENTDLVQTRPAFGGNIMARILTTRHRPQMATMRYKVMEPAEKLDEPTGEVEEFEVPSAVFDKPAQFVEVHKKPEMESIVEADVIVCAGRGISNEEDLDMVYELADLLGGMVGTTRPLIEKGWTTHKQQIGLSGRTVRPKLLIAAGVSGAVQWTAGMENSENVFAINKDPDASIFDVAHYGLVGDLYDILPRLIENIKNGADLEDLLVEAN
ncbi:MAG: electron transfer flavoprotein subunit alpha [Halanaerobacter sp.]